MRILAIDPSGLGSSYVVYDTLTEAIDGFSLDDKNDDLKWGVTNRETGQYFPHKYDNEHVLRIMDKFPCSHIAIEDITPYGQTLGTTTKDTIFWIGRFFQEAQRLKGCENVVLASRKKIITHLCGDPKAKDKNVRQVVVDRIGAPGTKKHKGPTYGLKGDLWQAAGVAVYAWDIFSQDIGEKY